MKPKVNVASAFLLAKPKPTAISFVSLDSFGARIVQKQAR
jgi:hypothetical protein